MRTGARQRRTGVRLGPAHTRWPCLRRHSLVHYYRLGYLLLTSNPSTPHINTSHTYTYIHTYIPAQLPWTLPSKLPSRRASPSPPRMCSEANCQAPPGWARAQLSDPLTVDWRRRNYKVTDTGNDMSHMYGVITSTRLVHSWKIFIPQCVRQVP